MIDPAFVVEQLDVQGGCIHGPFKREDIALGCYGHDENSAIVYVDRSGKRTVLHQWEPIQNRWIRVSELPLEREGKELALYELEREIYEIADALPLTDTYIRGFGILRPKIVIVGDYPEDTDREVCYSGSQGAILKRALMDANFTSKQVYITTLIKHAPFSDKDKLSYKEARRFVPSLLKEINILQPESVALLGLHCGSAVLEIEKLTQEIALENKYTLPEMGEINFQCVWHPKFVLHAGGLDSKRYKYYPPQFSIARKKKPYYARR